MSYLAEWKKRNVDKVAEYRAREKAKRKAIAAAKPRRTAIDRFERWYIPEPMSGCWLWFGAHTRPGYGCFWDGKRLIGAHRFAYEMRNGPVANGLFVMHKCDNSACCNPDHLFVGTCQDNASDMARKGRGSKSDRLPRYVRRERNGRFTVRVKHHGKSHNLGGSFASVEEASAAGQSFRIKLLVGAA